MPARCDHEREWGQCPDCESILALQTQWPALVGARPLVHHADKLRRLFSSQLESLRTFSEHIAGLPVRYWPLLQADQAFLDALSQESLLIAERGDALLQEETRSKFWIQHEQGQITGVGLTANQKTIALMGIPLLTDVAYHRSRAYGEMQSFFENIYRQALPRVVRTLLEWLVDGKTIARWQEERDARRRAQELLRPPPTKRRGGKRPGAGRPKKEPTRMFPLRVKDSLYTHLAALAQEADLPLSVFVEAWLEKNFVDK